MHLKPITTATSCVALLLLGQWAHAGDFARDVLQTQEFHKDGKVEVRGPGDFQHQYDHGGTNFRLREGEKATLDTRKGDRLHKEPSSLPPSKPPESEKLSPR